MEKRTARTAKKVDMLAHTLLAMLCVREVLGLCDTVEYLAERADELALKLKLDEQDKRKLIIAVEQDMKERLNSSGTSEILDQPSA
jgi:hypothetical protein